MSLDPLFSATIIVSSISTRLPEAPPFSPLVPPPTTMLGRIRVGALAQDPALRALLPAAARKPRVSWKSAASALEASVCVCGSAAPSRAEHVADLPLRDGDERHGVHAVLKWAEQVVAAAKHLGLEAGFAR